MPKLVLKIRLPGATGDRLSLSALADLFRQLEAAIVAQMRHDHPSLAERNLIVGLVSVKPGSSVIQIASNYPDEARRSAATINRAIQRGKPELLAARTRGEVVKMADWTGRYNTNAELLKPRGRKPQAEITADTWFDKETQLAGETIIYGTLERIGGATKPTAAIRLLGENRQISCEIDKKLAKELARRLYSEVALRGVGKWDARDLILTSFTVTEVLNFEPAPVDKAVAEIAPLLGPQWESVEDIDAYLMELREE